MKEFYYYYRSLNGNHPRIAVCLIVCENEYSRGIAICSKLDNINKHKGKALARGRALKALYTKQTTALVCKANAVDIIVDSTCPPVSHKSEYAPKLTKYESRLVLKNL